jgi:translation initiation factor IF-2
MSEENTFKKVRLFKVSKELNIGVESLIEHLVKEGYADSLKGSGAMASITVEDAYLELVEEFADDKALAARIKEKRAARESTESDEAEADGGETVPAEEEPVVEDVADAQPETDDTEETVTPEAVIEETEVIEEVVAETVLPEPDVSEPDVDTVAEEPAAEAEPEQEPEASEATEEEVIEAPVAEEPVADVVPEPDPVETEAVSETTAPKATVLEPAVSEVSVSEVTKQASKSAEPVDVKIADTTVESTAGAPEDKSGTVEKPDTVAVVIDEENVILADRYKLAGTKVLGKIDLAVVDPKDTETGPDGKKKRRRKRIATDQPGNAKPATPAASDASKAKGKGKGKGKKAPAVSESAVEQSLQETLRELEMGASRVRQKRRRQKREDHAAGRQKEVDELTEREGVLSITEFVSTGELAAHMDVPVNDVISTLFGAGLMVSINQRLDADTISFVADEYGYDVEFISDLGAVDLILEEDDPADLVSRPPVVTVMGHVDHGKTSLLDYIRKESVVSGEAGGITQHIGAYHVEVNDDKVITFLDTPGHEAFTAMRARGAQVTDIVILVVAADDAVMPQTIEAINHAKAGDVPIVVAVNKMDRAEANPDRVIQQLSDHGVLVEQYGGKVQCEYVSAHTGKGVQELLDRVLLEAELLDLKANPNRKAVCTVIESRKERGRGNVASVLVRNGTLKIGDPFVAGVYSGRVRAMFNENDQRVDQVGPSMPVQVIGLDGSPEVGDPFNVMDDEKEAKDLAQSRHQIHREQSLRQRKHITLDEIGRRLALGEFRELNLIVKGDVAGSVEALSDSLLKLSAEEVVVNIVHKGVGAISESDVTLALASNAIIIGFQVRPVLGARQMAEREEIDIRLYSVIYDAISEVRDALEGLLSPERLENITATVEVRETFKVPRQGMIAGCHVADGKIKRSDKIHLIRDGIVIYDGTLSSLKRFKDDVREVQSGYECGIGIENFNDLKIGDQIEAYVVVEKRRTLAEA